MRRDILLLQGPIGPFFFRLATELTDRGFRVHKVNLNGGDKLFYKHPGAIDYAGELQHWDAFLERLIINKKIGRIYLYGDCRVYHRIAREVAKRLDVRVFVFEEGYIRPNFITLEENGVNGHSSMVNKGFTLPRVTDTPPPESEFTANTFFRIACYSMMYYMSSYHRRSLFPGYQHHRDFRCISEGLRWINSGIRKLRFKRKEKHILSNLLPEFEGNYFVCPLQVHCDMQVVVHSGYNSIEHFIGEVMTSFAEHAPKNKAIVFKHHPLDRGYTDYTNLFANFVSELGLQGRVFYVHDVCLPTLLQHAQGTVVINSTVGMSSLLYGTPVKTLGKAIYNLAGITSKLSLDAFWHKPGKVDEDAFAHLRNYLVTQNQLNGNLYKPMVKGSASGLQWPEKLIAEHTYVADALDIPTTTPNLRIVAGLDVKTGTESDRTDDSKAA
jgi:capsule polysaccharide modification protein KpsS